MNEVKDQKEKLAQFELGNSVFFFQEALPTNGVSRMKRYKSSQPASQSKLQKCLGQEKVKVKVIFNCLLFRFEIDKRQVQMPDYEKESLIWLDNSKNKLENLNEKSFFMGFPCDCYFLHRFGSLYFARVPRDS